MTPQARIIWLAEYAARQEMRLVLTSRFGRYSAGRFGGLWYPGEQEKAARIKRRYVQARILMELRAPEVTFGGTA